MNSIEVTDLNRIEAEHIGKPGRILVNVTNSKQRVTLTEIRLLEGWKAEGLQFAFLQVKHLVPDACKVHITSFSISN